MAEMHEAQRSTCPEAAPISLRGFYLIGEMATMIGIAMVFVLNLATPLSFVLDSLGSLPQMDAVELGLKAGIRLIFIIVVTFLPLFTAMHLILRPIATYLTFIRTGQDPPADLEEKARRRLLNLPFIFIPINLGIWILAPAIIFFIAYLAGRMDTQAAVVFSIRASMVGLISSAIVFFGIESHSRKRLIPLFFPKGHLADMKGAARISISRRIRMSYRFGSLVPMTILVVTLLTLQWQVDPTVISAVDYGRGIITFTLILFGVFFFATGTLNRMVSRSIVTPINNMLSNVEKIQAGDFNSRIQVTGNDEIGILGDAGNAMIKGLAERDMIRTAFGKYVTPEIRDEILAGRIPLQGERREATVMFSDLRDFTPFVENNQPEEVIASMRTYFTAMHRTIRRHKGLVLQFVGDEIEAVFGVPVRFEDHAEAAVRAALEMRKALEEINLERSNQGKPAFSHGIGIHSGKVLSGNSGSEEQSAYSLIGNTVNVASRIQGLTKELGYDILASQETVEQMVGSCHMEKQSPRLVKGYSKPIIVYRILG